MSNERSALKRTSRLWILLVAALIIFANLMFAERIAVNGGLGWDGQQYAGMVMDPSALLKNEVPPYYVQRVLPSLAVHAMLRAAGVPLETGNIVNGFAVLNAMLLLLCVWLWLRISDELRFDTARRWFSGIALFVNFAVLKQFAYYPVLTDVAAYTLGMAFFYAYVTRQPLLMIILTVLGAFTWPIAAHVGVLLVVFNRSPRPTHVVELPMFTWLAAVGFAVVHGALIWIAHVQRSLDWAPVMRELLPLSAALSLAYVFFATRALLAGLGVRSIRERAGELRLERLMLGAGVGIVLLLVVRGLAGEQPGPNSRVLLAYTGFYPVAKPLLAVVGAAVFFGPVWLVLLLNWRRFADSVRTESVGIALILSLHVLISLVTEARMLLLAFPVITFLLARQLPEPWVRSTPIAVFGVLSLAWSKMWFTINVDGFPNTGGAEWEPAAQRYFMHHGPWMSDTSYLWQGALLLITAMILMFARLNPARREEGSTGVVAEGGHRGNARGGSEQQRYT